MDTKYTRQELEKALRFMLAMVQEPKLMHVVDNVFQYGWKSDLENIMKKANGKGECAFCKEPTDGSAYCDSCDKIRADL
jgi:hypothetical protein